MTGGLRGAELYRKNAAIRWIQTYTGIKFYPTDPDPEHISIVDIAHSLGNICRFNGHCKRFYSVAEHCVLVSHYVPEEYALWGLMHDAAEAYLSDLCRPIKPVVLNYGYMENAIMRAIVKKFGLRPQEPPEVIKRVDNALLADEARALMPNPPDDWYLPEHPVGARIVGLLPPFSGHAFFQRFECLTETGRG